MTEFNYEELNELFYSKKVVCYAWKKQDINKFKKLLKEFNVEEIKKSEWKNIQFIRDNSLLSLEDTFIITKNKKLIGILTPRKLIWTCCPPKKIKAKYKRPIGLSQVAYAFVLVLVNVAYFIMR